MRRQDLVDLSGDEDLLFADGLDSAILGVTEASPGRPALVVYDAGACRRLLGDEFFEFNTVGAWVGDRTPLFLESPQNHHKITTKSG